MFIWKKTIKGEKKTTSIKGFPLIGFSLYGFTISGFSIDTLVTKKVCYAQRYRIILDSGVFGNHWLWDLPLVLVYYCFQKAACAQLTTIFTNKASPFGCSAT